MFSHLSRRAVCAVVVTTILTACSESTTEPVAIAHRTPSLEVHSKSLPLTQTTPAALPALTVSTAPTPVTGISIAVHAGGNLQTALNSANRGDEIVLDAGVTYTGNFKLPAKPGTSTNGWVTIRTSNVAGLPAPGTRVNPAVHAAAMPKIITPNVMAAIATSPSATGYRLIGLEVTVVPSLGTNTQYGLVMLGDGGATATLATMASDLILDRMYIHSQPLVGTTRCVGLNGGSSAVVDSYLSECHASGFDAQAIVGWNGPGPYLIQNNHLEGSGENILFGGANPPIANLVPSDITIRQNYFVKPASWHKVWTAKNLFELKNAQRVLVEGNVFRNSWADAQVGFAVVMGSVNQGQHVGVGCTWCIVQDVNFRSNQIDSVAGGFNLFEGYPGAIWMRRVNVSNNVLTNVGVSAAWGGANAMFLVQGHVDDLAIENNTGFTTHAWLQFGDPQMYLKDRFTFRNNVGGNAQYNLQSPKANGGSMITMYCGTTYTFSGNVIVGAVSGLPAGNSLATSVASVGVANPVTWDPLESTCRHASLSIL